MDIFNVFLQGISNTSNKHIKQKVKSHEIYAGNSILFLAKQKEQFYISINQNSEES